MDVAAVNDVLAIDDVANGEVVSGEVEIDVGAVSAELTDEVVYGEVVRGVLVIEDVVTGMVGVGIDGVAVLLVTKLKSLSLPLDCICMTLKSFQSGRL